MEVRKSTNTLGNRKAPIPRPWLLKKSRSSSRDSSKPQSNIDILDKPRWTISWSKLSSCFCIGDQTNDRRHDVPFPAFPAIRRNSYSSYSSCALLNTQSDGSVSSFTESDTSSYSSMSSALHDEGRSEAVVTPRAATPPPAPSSKPAMMETRRRSEGLPPLNPSSSMTTPQPPLNRSRCDTGDVTKTSHTTNTSRHRRLEQFPFSQSSMNQIWGRNNTNDESVIPPSFVLCEDVVPSSQQRRDSGFISVLDMEDYDDHEHDHDPTGYGADWGIYLDGDKDDDDADNSYSPFAQLERKVAGERREKKELQRPPKAARQKPKQKRLESVPVPPVYLRKSPALEQYTEGKLVLSGWIAVSFGNDSLEARLQTGSKIKSSDIFYMHIVETQGHSCILCKMPNGQVEHSLTLQREWMCISREMSGRIGRCVVLQSRQATIATFLPVSLDDSFFCSGELVSSKQFSRMHDKLFVSGKGKVYAPDEQLDAAMFIMFSLDALIKSSGK